jgi:hypothetical protein
MMIIKILHIILLASVKYIFMLPYAMIIGLEFEQAVVAVLIGGIGGFLFFYYLSKYVIRGLKTALSYIPRILPGKIKSRYNNLYKKITKRKKPKIFTRKNRLIVRFRKTYGFWGIIVTTPPFLTIPLGAFLAGKYYSHRRHIVFYMIISIMAWAGILSGLIHLFPNVFLN